MNKHEIEEMEKQHAASYERMPSQPCEFEEWESEQLWAEDDKGKSEETIPQTAGTGCETKAIDEALERASEIRGKLEGRHHSDSTQIVSEDR